MKLFLHCALFHISVRTGFLFTILIWTDPGIPLSCRLQELFYSTLVEAFYHPRPPDSGETSGWVCARLLDVTSTIPGEFMRRPQPSPQPSGERYTHNLNVCEAVTPWWETMNFCSIVHRNTTVECTLHTGKM